MTADDTKIVFLLNFSKRKDPRIWLATLVMLKMIVPRYCNNGGQITYLTTLGWALWNWNSNLMIPDFPHIIKIRLAPLRFSFVASWLCKVRMQLKKFLMGPISFLYYEESLVVSSNLNSKLFWFHSAHPKVRFHFLTYFFRYHHKVLRYEILWQR